MYCFHKPKYATIRDLYIYILKNYISLNLHLDMIALMDYLN